MGGEIPESEITKSPSDLGDIKTRHTALLEKMRHVEEYIASTASQWDGLVTHLTHGKAIPEAMRDARMDHDETALRRLILLDKMRRMQEETRRFAEAIHAIRTSPEPKVVDKPAAGENAVVPKHGTPSRSPWDHEASEVPQHAIKTEKDADS